MDKASLEKTTSRLEEVADPASQKISLMRSKSVMIRMTQSDKKYQELKKLKAITMPQLGRHYLDLQTKSTFKSELFSNYGQVNFLNCFSALRSHYVLYRERFGTYKVETSERTNSKGFKKLLNSIQVKTPDENRDQVLNAFDGLRMLSFIFLSIPFTNYLQKDMNQQNRWKDLEQFMRFNALEKNLVTIIVSSIDYMFVMAAIIQTNKLFNHFKRLD